MLTDNKASKTGVKSPAERHSQRRSVAFYQGFGEVSLWSASTVKFMAALKGTVSNGARCNMAVKGAKTWTYDLTVELTMR